MKKGIKIVVANWKMNPQSLEEAKEIFKKTKNTAKKLRRTEVIVCPPFVYLEPLERLAGGEVKMGVQNIFTERSGAYTGEVSAAMTESLGAQYVICGHSERRAQGESDLKISKKVLAALGEGLTPILCIGERERDEEGNYLEFLKNQLKESLTGISKKDLTKIIIAYEPVWAIGKDDDEAMKGKDVYETALFIRKSLAEVYGKDNAFSPTIIYGAAVGEYNLEDIITNGNVSGLLVGHNSLKPEIFTTILKIIDTL